jgi:hypothetical protein
VTRLNKVTTGITRSPEEIRAENLRDWAETIPGTTRISHIKPRERVRVVGVIEKIRIDPREGSTSIEATFSDGTGQMVAKWLRGKVEGIRLGRGVIVTGACGGSGAGGFSILNPEYDLIDGPHHG